MKIVWKRVSLKILVKIAIKITFMTIQPINALKNRKVFRGAEFTLRVMYVWLVKRINTWMTKFALKFPIKLKIVNFIQTFPPVLSVRMVT